MFCFWRRLIFNFSEIEFSLESFKYMHFPWPLFNSRHSKTVLLLWKVFIIIPSYKLVNTESRVPKTKDFEISLGPTNRSCLAREAVYVSLRMRVSLDVAQALPGWSLFLFQGTSHFHVSSVQFSLSVTSDSLWSHGLQHARLPCPSPTPEACSCILPPLQMAQKCILPKYVIVAISLFFFLF